MGSTYIPGFPNGSGAVTTTGENGGSALTTVQIQQLISDGVASGIATVSTAVAALTSSITTDALTVSGTMSCGTHSMTCGAVFSGAITAGGTFSCGTNSATTGLLACGEINNSSNPIYCGGVYTNGFLVPPVPLGFINASTYSIASISNVASTCVNAIPLLTGNVGTIMPINVRVNASMTGNFSGTTGALTNPLCMAYGYAGTTNPSVKSFNFTSMTPGECETSGGANAYWFGPVAPAQFVESSVNELEGLDFMIGWNGTAPSGGTGTLTVDVVYANY